MEVTEAAQIPANQYEEAIWSRKQYLDSARGHYLTALAALSPGNQQQTRLPHATDSSLRLEDNICHRSALSEQPLIPGLPEQGNAFFEMDVQLQLPNGVFKASDRDLQAVKLRLSKTLAGNTKSHITEMICELGSFGKDLDITDVADLQTRTVSSESDDEPLPRTVVESSSLHRMVESLKVELENMKKEHAGLNDNDAGAEFAARNLHFSFFKSKPENGGCLAKRDKTRETSEKVTQDKDEVNDLKNKAKGLKRDLDAAKFSSKVEKRPRIALDIDETREGMVSLLDQVKRFPEGMHPACVSTSESSARIMISEDELESSSQQVEMSANFDRGTLIAPMGGVEGGKCDYASEFSIRDFVFAARNRDISHNWPFSEKNLQLCLKHGVKHILPPFKPTDSLRDSSIKRCLAEKILHSEESNLHEKQSMMRNHIVPGTIPELDHSWNLDLAEGYRDSDSFPSGGERDLAFKTNAAANSQSEVGSVSTSNLPLSEVSDEREAAGSAANNKTNSSASQLTHKKSTKVAMKMRVKNKRNTPEDITSACTVLPETNSSKICPVCESFSSSSNTALNAHIDQCLSSQSPPIWMKSSKLMKPRIKPRKIRLMTDICATAPCCTLEDLDRRNGTNWATNVDFPLEEADVPAEWNSPGISSRYLLNNADDGSVYIDSSGRKIRILSKFNDMPPSSFSKAREDLRPKKQSGKGKRSKFFSSNRKKRFAKHLKFLKVTRQRKRSFSLKVKGHSPEACWPKEAVRAVGVRQQPTSFVKEAQEQNHPGAAGSAKQCKSLKNSDSEANTKLSRCEVQAAEESLIGSDLVGSAEVEPRRTPVKKGTDLPKRFLSFTQRNLRTPAGVDQRSEGSSRGKMLGGRSLRGVVRRNRDASRVSLNSEAAQFNRKIAKESRPKSSDSTTAPAPLHEREADIQPNVVQNAAISFSATRRLLLSCHVGPSEGMKSCNLKTTLPPNRYSVHACQANSDKLGSALDNSRDCKGDNEAEAWSADNSQQSGAVIDHPISSRITESLGRSSVVKVRQKQAMEYSQDVSNDSNSNDGLTDDIHGNYGCVRTAIEGLPDDGEFIASLSSSGLAIGVNETSLRTAFDPEQERVADVSPQSKLLQCSDKFQGPLFRGQPGLNDNHVMCQGHAVDAQRLDQKTGDYILNFSHGSFFPEVDPIPIPGPPGSDLPSFSDMGSEDLHRSSLSSSLGQPSGDGDDGDLSECPFSAISAISNLGRSRTNDVIVNEQESLNVYPGWFGASPRPLPGISTVCSQFTAAESERIIRADNMEKGMVNLGGGAVILNGDIQQRYCSQKDEITQSTMTSQDSQLLAWRPMASMSFSVGNHTYSALDGQSIGLNNRSAVFSASSYRREESVNLAHSVETSHQSITSLENSAEAADPFPRTGNCDSTIPSAPILRLMGKDLRVSNRVDTDFSRSQAALNVGMKKLVKGSSEPESSRSPAFMGSLHEQNPHYLPARNFDVGSSNVIHSFGSHNQASRGMYLNEHMHTSFSVLGAGPWQR